MAKQKKLSPEEFEEIKAFTAHVVQDLQSLISRKLGKPFTLTYDTATYQNIPNGKVLVVAENAILLHELFFQKVSDVAQTSVQDAKLALDYFEKLKKDFDIEEMDKAWQITPDITTEKLEEMRIFNNQMIRKIERLVSDKLSLEFKLQSTQDVSRIPDNNVQEFAVQALILREALAACNPATIKKDEAQELIESFETMRKDFNAKEGRLSTEWSSVRRGSKTNAKIESFDDGDLEGNNLGALELKTAAPKEEEDDPFADIEDLPTDGKAKDATGEEADEDWAAEFDAEEKRAALKNGLERRDSGYISDENSPNSPQKDLLFLGPHHPDLRRESTIKATEPIPTTPKRKN